jgi:hypothetical protein
VRTLSEQVKFLTMNPPGSGTLHHLQQPQQPHNSPGPTVSHSQANLNQPHLRQQNLPPISQAPPNYTHNQGNFQQQTQPSVLHPPWFAAGIAAPQASHPATLPQPPQQQSQPQQERTPPIKPEQWDEIYLGVLHTQDASKLRELLSHTNPELIMPLNGPSLVSQAVILTLVHRVSNPFITTSSPAHSSFSSLPSSVRHRQMTNRSKLHYGGFNDQSLFSVPR